MDEVTEVSESGWDAGMATHRPEWSNTSAIENRSESGRWLGVRAGLKVSEAAELMEADIDRMDPSVVENRIAGFSIDSRTVEPGDLFFALSQLDYERAGFNGTFADGHEYIVGALGSGAIAAVARRDHASRPELAQFRDRLLVVEDCIAALQLLAHRVYKAWDKPVIAITGSAGKTTTKDLTANVVAASGRRVLKSERNYNNGLGLPLAVLQMVSGDKEPEQFDIAVLEMGMSSPTHEIQRLCKITPPDIAVELLVAPVHLEHLGTIENIAAAKAELIEGMKPEGVAVLNADDPFVMGMRPKHSGPVITFGVQNPADVTADQIDVSRFGRIGFRLRTPLGQAQCHLPLAGHHNLINALAAAAVGTSLEIHPEVIADVFRHVTPPPMRGEVIDFADGFSVVDDSYNSNPRSLLSMVHTLSESGTYAARRIVVAGEMLELGPDAAEMHRDAGRQIAGLGINVLWGVRGFAADIIKGAHEGGMPRDATRYFENSDEAAAALVDEVRKDDLVLVKGSRGVSTDRIVEKLRERFATVGEDEE